MSSPNEGEKQDVRGVFWAFNIRTLPAPTIRVESAEPRDHTVTRAKDLSCSDSDVQALQPVHHVRSCSQGSCSARVLRWSWSVYSCHTTISDLRTSIHPDTSCILAWLIEQGYEVYAFMADVGQEEACHGYHCVA